FKAMREEAARHRESYGHQADTDNTNTLSHRRLSGSTSGEEPLASSAPRKSSGWMYGDSPLGEGSGERRETSDPQRRKSLTSPLTQSPHLPIARSPSHPLTH